MKLVGVVGYHNSGKTTLVVKLARALKKRGRRVATVKHSPEGFDFPNRDTDRHKEGSDCVVGISRKEAVVFLKGERTLDEMLKHIEADYVLVEGFKEEKTFPRIVCAREEQDRNLLADGLEFAFIKNVKGDNPPGFQEINELVEIIEKKAFKLPNLNCNACGFVGCYEMAREIVKGKRSINDCVSLRPAATVKIGGRQLPMSPAMSASISSTINDLLSSLKGYRPGRVEIDIDRIPKSPVKFED